MKKIRYIVLFIVAFQSNAQISNFDHINFQKADSIALECKDEGLNNLPKLVYKLTSSLTTDVERFRAIYKWVCTNIENDYSMFSKNNRKRQKFQNDRLKLKAWNKHIKKKIFQALLNDQKTICTGYAYLIKEMSNLANLNCEIVQGYGKTSSTNIDELDTPNHSWNAIELNGKWYLCDPTWASGIIDPSTYVFKFNYNDGYFLTNPNIFSINHFPEDEKWLLIDNVKLTFEAFLEAPIIYGKAYTNLAIHDSPKKLKNNLHPNEKVTFKYELSKPINKNQIYLLVDNGFVDRKVQPNSILIKDDTLTLEHQFKTTGFYDVHLLIGDDLISSYAFKVKR